MAEQKDYYLLMELTPLVKEADIRKQYKVLAKKFHPDLNRDRKAWAETKMKELTEAYDVLTDREKRKAYDTQPHFQFRQPKGIHKSSVADPSEFSVKHQVKEKKPGFWEKFIKLITVPQEEPPKAELSKEGMSRLSMGLTFVGKVMDEGTLEMARIEFEAAAKDAPGNKDAVYNLGLVMYKLGRFEEALLNFRQIQRFDQKDPNVNKMCEILRPDAEQ